MTWARKCWENDWRPAREPEEQPPCKKATSAKGSSVIAVAAFLADSDEEEDVEDRAATPTEEVDEFTKYLAYSDAPCDTCIQTWWKRHSHTLPHMAKMARQFLSVPASSVGVERAFSKVSFMHSDLRKNLVEGTIQHSIMAAMNV